MAERKILTMQDLTGFLEHPVCHNYLIFLDHLNEAVRNCPRSRVLNDERPSSTIQSLLNLIDKCQAGIDKYLPSEQSKSSSRFGLVEFRDYHDHIVQQLSVWIKQMLAESSVKVISDDLVVELSSYFGSSFGNRQRIDYGTGHETHFLVFLYALDRMGLFTAACDYMDLVLRVFWRYLEWIRALLATYWLEAAGSHGVWGLDDYQFLPFYFGSSQLHDHKYIRPKSIHNSDIVREYAADYLYLNCIEFVNNVKKSASLTWHSPMLNDISGVKTWSKINQGMRKMYMGEVLGKLPIMQHLLMGKLFGNIGISQMSALELADFKSLLRDSSDTEMVEYVPSSGHSMPSNVISQLHNPHCAQINDESTGEFVETIVKYVTKPNGDKIPIYGRVSAAALEKLRNSATDTSRNYRQPEEPQVIDTFALGQMPPVCCGIKIPSAMGANAHSQGNIPREMMPFD